MIAVNTQNSISAEERSILADKENIRKAVIKDFEEIRKNINCKKIFYGALKIEHLKQYLGEEEFRKRKNFLLSEYTSDPELFYGCRGYKGWWIDTMYKDIIKEEIEKRYKKLTETSRRKNENELKISSIYNDIYDK